jgi:hypothetical protein
MYAHFFKRLSVADGILIIPVAILQLLAAIPAAYINFSWFCLAFLNVVSIVSFSLTSRSALHSSTQRFLMSITLSFIVKFVLCIIAIVAYVLIVKPTSILIVVPFFIFYSIFTFVEVTELFSVLKRLKSKE